MNDPNAAFEEDQLEELRQLLMSQIEIIDDLLNNYSIKIPAEDALKLQMLEWREQQKAPFHTSTKDNVNDAMLILSAFDFLRNQPACRFVFVSDNSLQFGDTKDKNILHADLAGYQFPHAVNQHYFLHIQDAFNNFIHWGLPQFAPPAIKEYPIIQYEIPVDRSLPMFTQLYVYLKRRFK